MFGLLLIKRGKLTIGCSHVQVITNLRKSGYTASRAKALLEWVQDRVKTLETVNEDNPFKNTCFKEERNEVVAE